jgi:Delta6-protoilludene synthase
MHQLNTDLPGAMEWVSRYHEDIEARFLDGLKRVPSFGTAVDHQLQQYIEHIANWPRCNDCWNFESGRYFGSKGLDIQRTRYVHLLPKRKVDPALRQQQVVVPIVDL